MAKKAREVEVKDVDEADVKAKADEEKKKAKDKYEGLSTQDLMRIVRDRDAIASNLNDSINVLSQRVDSKEKKIQELLEAVEKHQNKVVIAVNARNDAEKRAIEALNEQNAMRRALKEAEELLASKRAKCDKLKEQKRELFETKKALEKEFVEYKKTLTTAVALATNLINRQKAVDEAQAELNEMKEKMGVNDAEVQEECVRLESRPSIFEDMDALATTEYEEGKSPLEQPEPLDFESSNYDTFDDIPGSDEER